MSIHLSNPIFSGSGIFINPTSSLPSSSREASSVSSSTFGHFCDGVLSCCSGAVQEAFSQLAQSCAWGPCGGEVSQLSPREFGQVVIRTAIEQRSDICGGIAAGVASTAISCGSNPVTAGSIATGGAIGLGVSGVLCCTSFLPTFRAQIRDVINDRPHPDMPAPRDMPEPPAPIDPGATRISTTVLATVAPRSSSSSRSHESVRNAQNMSGIAMTTAPLVASAFPSPTGGVLGVSPCLSPRDSRSSPVLGSFIGTISTPSLADSPQGTIPLLGPSPTPSSA